MNSSKCLLEWLNKNRGYIRIPENYKSKSVNVLNPEVEISDTAKRGGFVHSFDVSSDRAGVLFNVKDTKTKEASGKYLSRSFYIVDNFNILYNMEYNAGGMRPIPQFDFIFPAWDGDINVFLSLRKEYLVLKDKLSKAKAALYRSNKKSSETSETPTEKTEKEKTIPVFYEFDKWVIVQDLEIPRYSWKDVDLIEEINKIQSGIQNVLKQIVKLSGVNYLKADKIIRSLELGLIERAKIIDIGVSVAHTVESKAKYIKQSQFDILVENGEVIVSSFVNKNTKEDQLCGSITNTSKGE